MARAYDVGTFTLVCAKRNENKDIEFNKEVNAFIELPLENRFVFNMMKNAGVPLIEKDDVVYALGKHAVDMAYTINALELKRPMYQGCVNPKEQNAFKILSIMIHSMIGELNEDGEVLYYTIPANAINQETDADYHNKILQAIFKAYKDKDGKTVKAYPVNEGLSVVYAELASKSYTGVGISAGAGMVNVCFSIFGNPVFSFAIANSGDWIDKQAAHATGETTTYINKRKNNINLSIEPTNMVERAIQTQYQLMIEKTVGEIKKGLENLKNQTKVENPVDIVIAGGTSSPEGFDTLFEKVIREANLSIPIGQIRRVSDPVDCIARGALIAAENHN